MANRIQIRHGTNAPTNNQLLPYELGWGNGALYIGNPTSGQAPINIVENILNNITITINANATSYYWNLTGTNGNKSVTYSLAPYSSRQNSACFYSGTTAPNGTTRLNYNGYLYATKLYSNGTEVLTSHQSLAGYLPVTGGIITGNLTVSGTTTISGYLPLTGGNITGNTWVSGVGLNLGAKDTTNQLSISVIVDSGHQEHGLYSNGYASTSTTLTSDPGWIIYRDQNGKINIPQNKSGNILWSDLGRRIWVQNDATVPSSAVNGDIVLVKIV